MTNRCRPRPPGAAGRGERSASVVAREPAAPGKGGGSAATVSPGVEGSAGVEEHTGVEEQTGTEEQAGSDDYALALARVRAALERHAGESDAGPAGAAPADGGDADTGDAETGDGETAGAETGDGPLARLVRIFGLAPFERDVLMLCAGMELDASFAPLCASAQVDPGRAYPTFGLALAVPGSADRGGGTGRAAQRVVRSSGAGPRAARRGQLTGRGAAHHLGGPRRELTDQLAWGVGGGVQVSLRAVRQSATGRSYLPHISAVLRTSAAFEGASVLRSSRTLSSSPVRAWPPDEIAQSFRTIWLAPIPAAHQGTSSPNRRCTVRI